MKISISHLSKSFFNGAKERKILNDVSVEFNFSHVLALLGPSGSGKTTLLRILAGLEIPDQGSIAINGEKLLFESQSLQRYRQTLGVVFQNLNLFPHYTVFENIMLPLTVVHREDQLTAQRHTEEIMERLQITQHKNKKPHQLSGGENQRVAIARSLAVCPEFLLFDEPTSALDPEMTSEVLSLIEELRDQNIPLFLVTHEIHFARNIADQIAFLSHGVVLEQGPTEEFFLHPKTKPAQEFLKKVLAY